MITKAMETKFNELCKNIRQITKQDTFTFPLDDVIHLGDDVVLSGVLLDVDEHPNWGVIRIDGEIVRHISLSCVSTQIYYQVIMKLGKAYQIYMPLKSIKASFQKKYNTFKKNNGCEPNCVWINVIMKSTYGYDTPLFSGYAILDNQVYDAYPPYQKRNGSIVNEADIIYYTENIESLIHEITSGDTDFNLISIGDFEVLKKC